MAAIYFDLGSVQISQELISLVQCQYYFSKLSLVKKLCEEDIIYLEHLQRNTLKNS